MIQPESIFSTNGPDIDNMTPDQAYDFLKGLADHIRDLIESNPAKNLGEIADLINYP